MATKAEHVTALKAKHSSLTRNVNGVRETLSPSEYEATIDQWATNSAATDVRNALIASGGESSDYAALRTDSMLDDSYPTILEFIEAYCEKEIGSDSTKWNAYVTAYNATRAKYQKPS